MRKEDEGRMCWAEGGGDGPEEEYGLEEAFGGESWGLGEQSVTV